MFLFSMPAYDPFKAFNPYEPTARYRRNLPHLRQPGATYFVTKRLADSIPRIVLEEWKADQRIWEEANGLLHTMSDKQRTEAYEAIPHRIRQAHERERRHQLEFSLDACHGSCVMRKPAAAGEAAKALRFFDGDRLQCGDFVVMPNHIHWLVMPLGEFELERVVQSTTRHAAAQINRTCGRSGTLWQKESYDRLVRNREELARIRKYIEDNPKKAGLREGEFVYFRAPWPDE
jgi:putative transposase